jgi:uncharacterized membrane protein YhaH (DUF805 family)
MVDLDVSEPRSFLSQLFSFRGRSRRANFWLTSLVVGIVYFIVLIAGLVLDPGDFRNPSPAGIVVLLLNWFVCFAFMVLASIRRLHDRDKSGHWLWLFSFLPAVISGAGYVAAQQSPDRLVVLALSVVGFVLSLWGGIEIGFLRGTPGPNRFGPDPAAGGQRG